MSRLSQQILSRLDPEGDILERIDDLEELEALRSSSVRFGHPRQMHKKSLLKSGGRMRRERDEDYGFRSGIRGKSSRFVEKSYR